MKLKEKMVYKNDSGESIEFSFQSHYIPLSIEETLDYEIATSKNSNQDGATAVSGVLSSRSIALDGFFRLSLDSNTLECKLKRVFNPKLKGKLIFYALDYTRNIDVLLEGIPNITREGTRANFSIDMVAHFPFWTEKEKVEYIAILMPKLHFPLSIPKDRGIVFGVRKSILETKVENVGDVESGFRVIFRAKGMVKNPYIIDTITGKKIRINYTMKKDDMIEVINQPNLKRIYINEINSFQNLDRINTEFFNLKAGENIIGYQADENLMNLDVILYYSPLFL